MATKEMAQKIVDLLHSDRGINGVQSRGHLWTLVDISQHERSKPRKCLRCPNMIPFQDKQASAKFSQQYCSRECYESSWVHSGGA